MSDRPVVDANHICLFPLVGGVVKFPSNCPSCNAPLDWTNDETDIVGCHICGGWMCWKCGSPPEGICGKCGEKMFNESAPTKESESHEKVS